MDRKASGVWIQRQIAKGRACGEVWIGKPQRLTTQDPTRPTRLWTGYKGWRILKASPSAAGPDPHTNPLFDCSAIVCFGRFVYILRAIFGLVRRSVRSNAQFIMPSSFASCCSVLHLGSARVDPSRPPPLPPSTPLLALLHACVLAGLHA